jgi:hypothetical protein
VVEMTALYGLSAQYHELLKMVNEPEISKELLTQAIEDVTAGIEAKCRSISAIIMNLRTDSRAFKEEESRMSNERKSIDRKIEWLSQYMLSHMIADNIQEVKSATYTTCVRENPPAVIIDAENLIPERYIESVITQKVHKADILKSLRAGVSVPGAHLEIGQRLEIK